MSMSRVKIPRLAPRVLALVTGMLLTIGLAVSLDAGGAWADDVDGIAGAPAANGGVDQSRSRFSYQMDPGQVVADEYLVQNTGTTAQLITIYATDAFNSDDGGFSLLEGGVAPVEAGHWVSFADGVDKVVLTLQAGESQVIPFTVSAPADASPGDHAGGIIASALSPSGQISLDRRVAIRLYVRVKGELQTGLTISSIASSYQAELNPFSGTTEMTITMNNTGNVALGATTVAQVHGLFGIPLSGTNREEIPEMLPGTTRTLTVSVPGVGPWVYLNPQVSLAASIDDEALNPGVLPTATRESDLLVMPWGLLCLILLAVLVWFTVRAFRRRGRRHAAAWLEYNEAEARLQALEPAPTAVGAQVGSSPQATAGQV